MKKLLLCVIFLFGGCAVAPPSGVTPITGFELRDHRDWALWLGRSHPLDLSVLDADEA